MVHVPLNWFMNEKVWEPQKEYFKFFSNFSIKVTGMKFSFLAGTRFNLQLFLSLILQSYLDTISHSFI